MSLSISASTVQKTLKREVTTVYGEVSIGAAGAATLVTEDGASLGISSVELTEDDTYLLTLDTVAPIQLFLGGVGVIVELTGSTTDAFGYQIPQILATDTVAKTIEIGFAINEGAVFPHILPDGSHFYVTVNYTTAKGF